MKTIRFSIKTRAIDSYIYSGHLFIVLEDGRLIYTELSKIIRQLVEAYPSFQSLIRLSFQRNDYLSNRQGQMILGIGELMSVLVSLWERTSEEIQFAININLQDFNIISEVPSMPLLDMKLYAMRMYLGCKEGLYEINLNPKERYHLHPGNPKKRFDTKITHLAAKSGEIIISADNEGLYHGSFLNDSNQLVVNEKPAASKSIRTGWSNFDVINYEENDNFEYFENETSVIGNKPEYSKFDERSERRRITEFGKSRYGLSALLERSSLELDDISYCFNSSKSGFFFTRDGRFVNINLSKDKGDLHFTSRTNVLPNLNNSNGLKRPVSSAIVPNGCVVEYFDKVVLYQNSQAKIIETGPSINIRTYASSIRYRNLITITKEDELVIHSIYPFDESQPKLTFDEYDKMYNE